MALSLFATHNIEVEYEGEKITFVVRRLKATELLSFESTKENFIQDNDNTGLVRTLVNLAASVVKEQKGIEEPLPEPEEEKRNYFDMLPVSVLFQFSTKYTKWLEEKVGAEVEGK